MAQSDLVRRRYNRIARFYDLQQLPMERFAGRWRRAIWGLLPPGDVLEIGVGTGANIKYHPPGVRVVAFDIAEKMLARSRVRSARLAADIDLVRADVERLSFPDGRFDSAVATFVFCSVADPLAGLREVRRVLRPGGTLLLLEHVRSPNPIVGRLMDAANPVIARLAGANINRRTLDVVRAAGFEQRSVGAPLGGIVQLVEATNPW